MKQFYLFFYLILTAIISHAQIGKGTVILGGNLEYDKLTQSSNTSVTPGTFKGTNFGINPSFGKAIKDNLVLGFDVTYGHSTNTNNANLEGDRSNSFGAGIFVRKYKTLGNGFYLFGESRLGGTYGHTSTTDNSGSLHTPLSNVTNTFGLSLQFAPGIAYALDRRWQLEISLPNFVAVNYSHSKQTETYTGQPEYAYTTNSFSAASTLTGNNSVSIGVKYLIGGPAAH